jgi:hypothetical protein
MTGTPKYLLIEHGCVHLFQSLEDVLEFDAERGPDELTSRRVFAVTEWHDLSAARTES